MQSDIHKASKKRLEPDHPITMISLLRLSKALATKGDIKKAIKIAKKARERRVKILDDEHPSIVAAQAWLEQLLARKQSKINIVADVTEDMGPTRDREKSLEEETNKDHSRGFLDR